MKKLVFMFFVTLGVTLTGCSCFDSNPIHPKIIGVGNVQYDAANEFWYVIVDSAQYAVTTVTIPDHNPRVLGVTQEVEPVEGMLVTIFTSENKTGMQAVTGRQSVEKIEAMYHTNSTLGVILFCILALCILGTCFFPQKCDKRNE